MTHKTENLITWIMMAVGFLGIIWWGSVSMEFQRACENKCGNEQAITPLVGLREVCLCEGGHGKWQKVGVSDVTISSDGG